MRNETVQTLFHALHSNQEFRENECLNAVAAAACLPTQINDLGLPLDRTKSNSFTV